MKAYHGNRTDQFNTIAARLNSVTSVTTAPPFWNNNPPTAGNKASTSGAECQCDVSSWSPTSEPLGLGRIRLSVDEKMDCLASSNESENVELLLFLKGFVMSANVEARPKGRNCKGD